MSSLSLTSFGGAGTVTGSKHLVTHGDTRLMIDCGLFQGLKNLREMNWKRLPLPAEQVDAVILTHAHLDHCGYLPRLVRDGFRGPVYATPATRELAALILRDSAHLQEKDADFANRKGFSKHKPAQPLYTTEDAERAIATIRTVDFHQWQPLPGAARLRFHRAGHILGAAHVQLEIGGRTLAFSGDLGRYNDPVMHDPEPISNADYVVIESTYGNRIHEQTDPVQVLGDVIRRTLGIGGTVLIPAFAVGRTQSLIHHLWQLRQAGHLDGVPVYLDSPMATSASELLCRFLEDHRLPAPDCKAACDAVTYIRDVEESKALSASRFPKVIISASGMASGGRVLHHIAAFGPHHRNTLLFSGYQAAGTRGRRLMEGAREVKIHGQWVPINATVANLPALSAHADSNELMRWLSGLQRPPQRVFVVHGESEPAVALQQRIEQELGWQASVPEPNEIFSL